jgi:hypothetical protein
MAVIRALRRAVTALTAVVGLALLASVVATSAQAQGPTRENLVAHGWTCVEFAPANRWSCFNPGVGRPFPGDPNPAPSYNVLGFDLTTGEFLYTGHLSRQDLYRGQPCAPGGDPYVFRAPIGYYECVRG